MIWYLEDLLRFRQERLAVEELLERAEWLTPAGGSKMGDNIRLTWDGDIASKSRIVFARAEMQRRAAPRKCAELHPQARRSTI